MTPYDPPAAVTGAESIRMKSSAQKVVVAKFDDRLTSEVAKSSRRCDNIRANKDMIDKLVNVLLSFSFLFHFFYSDQVGTCFRWSPSCSLAMPQPEATLNVWTTKWPDWSPK